MENKFKISLINGEFTLKEAKEVLLELYTAKIDFHKMRNFSSLERFGVEDQVAVKRIEELKESITKLSFILKEAHDKTITINAEVEICLKEVGHSVIKNNH